MRAEIGRSVSRRKLLAGAALGSGAMVVLAACGEAKVVEKITTVEVIKEVEKVVTKEISIEKIVTVQGAAPQAGPVKVNFATDHTSGARGKATEWALAEFAKLEPNVIISVVHRPGGEQPILLASGSAPEAMLGNQFVFTNFLTDGSWADISDIAEAQAERMMIDWEALYFAPDLYTDNNWDHSFPPPRRIQGPMYGMSYQAVISGWMYNINLFEAGGVAAPTEDWTWDNVLEAGRALTNEDSKTFGMAPPNNNEFAYLPLMYSNGLAKYVNDDLTHAPFDEPAAVEAMTWAINTIFTEKIAYAPEGAKELQGEFGSPFEAGRAGMLPSGLAIGNQVGRIGDRFRMSLMPTPKSPRTGEVGLGWNDQPYMVTRAAERLGNLEETAKMVLFFGGQMVQNRIGIDRGQVPNNSISIATPESLAGPPEGMEQWKIAMDRCNSRHLYPFDALAEFQSAAFPQADRGFAGEIGPDEVGAAMAAAGDAVLANRQSDRKPTFGSYQC